MHRIFLAILLILLPLPAAAGCGGEVAAAPEAEIILALPDVVESHQYSWRNFTPPSAIKHGQDTLGLSRTRDKIEFIPRVSYMKEGDHVCARIMSVRMIFGYESREVLIAKEAPEGSCLYNQIREHEYRHAAIDAHSIREYAGYLRDQLAAAAAHNAVVRARTGEDAAQIAATRIMEAMRPAVRHVIERKNAMQRRVDTPEEYARISSICRVDIQTYVR